MKIILSLIMTIYTLLANNILHIKANTMQFDINKKNIVFLGNIRVTNNNIFLKADKLKAKFSKKNLKSFNAHGNIFVDYKKKDIKYNLHSNDINYQNVTKNYILSGNVSMQDNKSKKILANKVTINALKNTLEIEGDKQPAILELKIKNDK